jgi:hypothetical protein
MLLSTIQPADDGFDLRSFRCRGCGHSEAFQSTLTEALHHGPVSRLGGEDGPGRPDSWGTTVPS